MNRRGLFLGALALALPWSRRAAAHAWYDGRCCYGDKAGVTGDCQPIRRATVDERPDGYVVTLRPGDHPFVKGRVLTKFFPHAEVLKSQDEDHHACVDRAGTFIRCFYANKGGF